MSSIARTTSNILKSSYFFSFTLFVFVLESIWVALSSGFPMAFDEGYHFNMIKLYSQHLGPLYFHQPPGPAVYGALPQNTSFLYHYLMSFPYRLLSLFSKSEMIHVMTLRLIDILFFAASLILMRKVLLKTKASPAVINLSIFFFILLPIVPLLAGQVTYDDGLMLVVGATLLLCVKFAEGLKNEKRVKLPTLFILVSLALLGCLVKFPYLPIFTGIIIYLAYIIGRFAKSNRALMVRGMKKDWLKLGLLKKLVLMVFLLGSLGMWLDVYGYNLIEYKNPVPQCNQILNVKACMSFDPWARNYEYAKGNTGVDINPLRFSASWIYGMFYRLFFTINGPAAKAYYDNHLAPGVTIGSAIIVVFGTLLFVFRYGWQIIKKDWALLFLLFITLIYTASLWGRNYHDFLHLGRMVAINGRYLIPVILPVYIVIGMSYQRFTKKSNSFQAALLGLACLVYFEGGGIIGFVYYSNSAWYWPGSPRIVRANSDARNVVKTFFISRKH